MSPTLLELAVALILIVVAWQIGVIIAPWIFQRLRGLKHDLDEVAEEIGVEGTTEVKPNHAETPGTNHKYRNN